MINSTNEIINTIPLNYPDSILFEIAKEIIYDEPDWQAEVQGGKRIESEVTLKLKFKY